MKKLNIVIYILPLLILCFAYVNCSSNSNESGQAISPQPNVLKVDPWNAPVGELVAGAQLADGWTDLRLLPAPVNVKGGWTDSAAISNDGMSLYFAYARFSFSDIIDKGIYNMNGPLRSGMSGDYMKNFRADLTSDGWVINYLSTNGNINQNEGSLSTNAAQDLQVFAKFDSSIRPLATIYYSAKNSNGAWSTPQKFDSPVNNPKCSNDNPFIIGSISTGVDIYFDSDRADLDCTARGTKKHIYHSFFNPKLGTYTALEKVAGVNGLAAGDEDYQPFISQDKKHFYWTGTRASAYAIFSADLYGTSFLNTRPVVQPNYNAPYTGKLVFIGESNIVETSQGYLMYMICGIATNEVGITHGAELKICRAKKSKYPEAAKKINTDTGWSDSPFISRDGKRLYFMYSRWDFAPFIKSLGAKLPVLTGPDRLGLNHSDTNPFDESDIYMSTKNADGTWSEPANLGLNGKFGDASGMEFNNGNSFIWLHGDGSKNSIVIANRNSDGTWADPVDLGPSVNATASAQDNPHISADGNAVWFVSNRTGGLGKKDIYFTSKAGGSWAAPVNVGAPFNTAGDEDQPFVSSVTNDVYWNSAGAIKHCISNGSTCSGVPDTIVIPGCSYAAEVSLPDDMQTMFFACGDLNTARVKIMYSKKSGGLWGPATPVD